MKFSELALQQIFLNDRYLAKKLDSEYAQILARESNGLYYGVSESEWARITPECEVNVNIGVKVV